MMLLKLLSLKIRLDTIVHDAVIVSPGVTVVPRLFTLTTRPALVTAVLGLTTSKPVGASTISIKIYVK